MNDFFYIVLGVMFMMIQAVLTVLVTLGIMPPMIFILASTFVGCIAGIVIAALAFLAKGILAPAVKCRLSGQTLMQVLTAGKLVDFCPGKEQCGICDTERGSFLTPIDSIYQLPNGVRCGIAHFKYGVSLKPNLIKSASMLRNNNINDINQLETANEILTSEGKQMNINLSAPTEEPKVEIEMKDDG